jgi:hypothetical protein
LAALIRRGNSSTVRRFSGILGSQPQEISRGMHQFFMAGNFNEAEAAQNRQMLEIAFNTLKRRHIHQPGNFVRWKMGMKNRKLPAYGEPAIVVEVLPAPIYDRKYTGEAESPLFHEPLDLVLGLYAANGEEFHLLHFDSRRFEPFPR